jgi:hypothetical protein
MQWCNTLIKLCPLMQLFYLWTTQENNIYPHIVIVYLNCG